MKEQQGTGRLPHGRILAAPSWVIPAGVAENCRFLAGRVDEVGLLFLESEACLAYSRHDLPVDLADLPLSWHVHLPVDLPWGAARARPDTAHRDGSRCADICLRLMDKVDYLGAVRGVVHPPAYCHAAYAAQALEAFTAAWTAAGLRPEDILLENIQGQPLTELAETVRSLGLSVCLDTGHMLSYGQHGILRDARLTGRIRMLHLNAERAGRHVPLTVLHDEALRVCASAVQAAPCDSVVMMELFDWKEIEESLPVAVMWLRGSG
ncbi:cobamide remodeling phosphodiesterase CbiR [Oleidesulfovibrio alaskensis]|jgi:sugar phosphate isomerase/epimerase|uniref:cobamide remodeling phosphodiesterase CbiR n=1 Tax=Oleidesulfovibrio alaskensis TaxID=58180 RepID=UPI000400745C|nr:cobamide remodeling phosphodiesterase CbiR [Oleidesulfovibrio alaskensis]